jgi:hypothetical protein
LAEICRTSLGRQPEHVLDLEGAAFRIGRRQVDLVEHGHDLEVVLHGLVAVGQGLGLDPLRGVHQEDRPLAGGERAAHLVAEVDVAGGVDEVEDMAVVETRTFWALMVMPRSRSMSMESRYCSRISRGSTAPVISRMRSDRVDLPWSTWLMMEKLRMCSMATGPLAVDGGGTVRRSYRPTGDPGRLARALGATPAEWRQAEMGRDLLQLSPHR